MKRGVRRFYVVAVWWTSKKCTKKRMHVQSCCFARKTNFFLRCGCRRRRDCLSSLLTQERLRDFTK